MRGPLPTALLLNLPWAPVFLVRERQFLVAKIADQRVGNGLHEGEKVGQKPGLSWAEWS